MGLLDGDLQALMAQFQVPEEERRRIMQSNLLMGLGTGLLGARRGQEFNALGRGVYGGMEMGQNQLEQLQRSKLQGLQGASAAYNLLNQKQGYDDNQAAREVARNFYGANGLPSVPPSPPAQFGMNDRSMGEPPAGPPPASGLPPAPVAPPTGAPSKQSKFEQYSALAQQFAAKGLVTQAQQYSDLAEKYRPQLDSQKVYTQNGKRVVVNVYKDGTREVLPDLGPDQDPLHFSDNGQRTGIGQDVRSGEVVAPGIQRQQTPESLATEATAKRGQDITMRGQNMVDARARENNATQDRLVAKQDFQNANTLRDEYNKLSAPFISVRDAHRRVLASAKDPSAAGDLALIFNYMKVLDPNSTVREGEFATAQNAGGVNDRVASMYNRVLNGERLSDNIRADMVSRSGSLYKKQEESYGQVRDQYKAIAQRNGINPDNVLVDFNMGDSNATVKSGSGGLSPQEQQELDQLRKKHRG